MTTDRPIGLADLIRDRRHILELRLTTPAELGEITGGIDHGGGLKGYLRGWQAIAIVDHQADATTLHLVGYHSMRSWITSDLLVISPDRSLVRTRNSIYGLGGRAEADLSLSHLITVSRALQAWGLVDRYGLELARVDDIVERDDA